MNIEKLNQIMDKKSDDYICKYIAKIVTKEGAMDHAYKCGWDASTEHWRKICEWLVEALEFYSKQSNFEKTVWENDDMSGPCEPYDFENGELLERHPDGVLSEFGILAEKALAEYRKQIGGAE